MKLYKHLNKIQNSILIPFLVSSVFIIISELSLFLSSKTQLYFSTFFFDVSKTLPRLVSFVFSFFLIYLMSDGKRGIKAFWSLICLLLLNALSADTELIELLFLFSVILSAYALFCYRYFELWSGSLIIFVITLVFSILIISVDAYYSDLILKAAELISNKGALSSALFGLFKIPLSLFNETQISSCIFHTGFGGSYLIDEKIITGAKDLYESSFRGISIYTYLSGHYYALFAVVGVFISLLDELKGVQKITLCFVFASTILSGNMWLFVLFTFFECPYFLLLLTALSTSEYLVAYIIKLSCGYIFNGSFIEMLFNIENGVYLFAIGIIFVCIGYFTARFVISKYSISDKLNIYIPSRLNAVVTALGGIKNISKAKENYIIVRNPEIIDKLKLECEIEGNKLKSPNEDFIELIKYLQ